MYGNEFDIGMMNQPRMHKPGKQEIINWFREFTQASEMDLVEDAFDTYARHVCLGGESVQLLPKMVYNLQTPEGYISLEYYRCNLCGKVILNKNFM